MKAPDKKYPLSVVADLLGNTPLNDVVFMPDKIYFDGVDTSITPRLAINEEYIRKDVVDGTIKTAEDHAYFAGQEKFREKLIEWAKENMDSLGRLSYGELIDKLNSVI